MIIFPIIDSAASSKTTASSSNNPKATPPTTMYETMPGLDESYTTAMDEADAFDDFDGDMPTYRSQRASVPQDYLLSEPRAEGNFICDLKRTNAVDAMWVRESAELSSEDERHGVMRRSLFHVATLVLVTFLMTAATCRHTLPSLQYKLHFFGEHQMRGVPTSFQKKSGRSLVDDNNSDSEPLEQESFRAQEIPPTSAAHPMPLMMPRQFRNQRGDEITIPRGVPLPPPLLTLVEVKMCSASHDEGSCLGSNTGEVDANLGVSLECSWCGAEDGGCVPSKMREVMCGQ
jgi:hypothetical protein